MVANRRREGLATKLAALLPAPAPPLLRRVGACSLGNDHRPGGRGGDQRRVEDLRRTGLVVAGVPASDHQDEQVEAAAARADLDQLADDLQDVAGSDRLLEL